MGRDKKNKPKKLDKIQQERVARRNQVERQREEENDDGVQDLLRFLNFSPPVHYSRDDVFKALFEKASKIIEEKTLRNHQVHRTHHSTHPHQEVSAEAPQDQPGPSGIDYERERRERRLPSVKQEVVGVEEPNQEQWHVKNEPGEQEDPSGKDQEGHDEEDDGST